MDRGGRSEKSGDGCGRCCLGFLLNLLTFLQAFATLSVILYAASILSDFILSRWARHHELHIHHLLPDLWLAVKKSKAEKDPNKPKCPPSAFFVFM
ncbi:hypothetical protein ZWY2020_054095 [Hordeum vulgare]|nr:hypothetical protein ZWY2020_054095 [Hordeum vulgare]